MSKGPGLFSDIGKKAKGNHQSLLLEDYRFSCIDRIPRCFLFVCFYYYFMYVFICAYGDGIFLVIEFRSAYEGLHHRPEILGFYLQ